MHHPRVPPPARLGPKGGTMKPYPVTNISLLVFFGFLVMGSSVQAYDKLTVLGETALHGIYDPSLEYTADGATGYLAYSSVQFPEYVHTNVAITSDSGNTWIKLQQVNTSTDDTLVYIDHSRIAGVWRHEVATIVHDPADPDPGRRWKMFWHHYFTRPPYEGEDRMVAYGWIAYKYATMPEGPWSAEEALFGAGGFPPAPYDFTRLDINALHPDLVGYVGYTEPGSICRDGVLFLSLSCLSVAGTALDSTDAAALGYIRFDGTSLAEEAGRVFLLCTAQTDSTLHDGMVIFEFDDIAVASVRRDSAGMPLIHGTVGLQPELMSAQRIGGGQGDYDRHNAPGIIMPQLNLSAYPNDIFQVFRTDRRILEGTGITAVPPDRIPGPAQAGPRVFAVSGRHSPGAHSGIVIEITPDGRLQRVLRIQGEDK